MDDPSFSQIIGRNGVFFPRKYFSESVIYGILIKILNWRFIAPTIGEKERQNGVSAKKHKTGSAPTAKDKGGTGLWREN
ncbi:MAG: hypothetical protein ACOX8R_04290 [Bacillota bacterium]|jgi:hypothetical protein